jgi:hypothetical protein
MTVTVNDVRAELAVDFLRTCQALEEARLQRQAKDTPDSRSAVQDCRAQIDRVLDMYLDMVRAPEGRVRGA